MSSSSVVKLGDNGGERIWSERKRVPEESNFVSGPLRPISSALRGLVLSAGFVSEAAFGNGATGGLRKGTKNID